MIQGTNNSVLNINSSFYGPSVNNPVEPTQIQQTEQDQQSSQQSESSRIQETDKGSLIDVTV